MYRDLYYLLFNSITDALHQLEKNNIGMAEEILRNAQITAEEEYLQGGD